jgi:hypothetical protein
VLGLDVDPADGAALVEHEPLVDAGHVEQVHARQPADVLVDLEF